MNSDDGVKTYVGKNRRNRRKKASKDTEEIGHKMKSITIADVENDTGVKTNVVKNSRNRRKRASKDTEDTVDKMKSITIADVENHTGKKRSYDNSVGVKEKVEEVSMKSNDDSDDSDESWGHDHSKCFEERESLRLSERRRYEHTSLLFDKMMRGVKMDKWDVEEMKMHKVDVEMKKRLEEKADMLKLFSPSPSNGLAYF